MTPDMLTTQQVSELTKMSLAQVQRVCKLYQEGRGGMACVRIGNGRHSTYFIKRDDALAYTSAEHKRGWPKGKKRKP